jgi:ketosteroid isomerase-like protein
MARVRDARTAPRVIPYSCEPPRPDQTGAGESARGGDPAGGARRTRHTPPTRTEDAVSAEDNLKTIQSIYEAFVRGDVAVILDALTDDVDWGAETTSDAAPWYGQKHGRDAVAGFFEAFGSTIELQEFTPVTYAANANEVLTVVRFRGTARTTGRQAAMNLHHRFTFTGDKISYFCGTEDTAQTEAVLRTG